MSTPEDHQNTLDQSVERNDLHILEEVSYDNKDWIMNPEHHAELQSLLSDVAQSSQNYNFSDVEQSVETILKFDVIPPLVKAVEPVDQPEQTVPSVKDEKTAKKRPVETALKPDRPKRVRTNFTSDQLSELESLFRSNEQYVTKHSRSDIAKKLSLSDRIVKVWFQNRRMKAKKEQEKKEQEEKEQKKKEQEKLLKKTNAAQPSSSSNTPSSSSGSSSPDSIASCSTQQFKCDESLNYQQIRNNLMKYQNFESAPNVTMQLSNPEATPNINQNKIVFGNPQAEIFQVLQPFMQSTSEQSPEVKLEENVDDINAILAEMAEFIKFESDIDQQNSSISEAEPQCDLNVSAESDTDHYEIFYKTFVFTDTEPYSLGMSTDVSADWPLTPLDDKPEFVLGS